MNPNALTPFRSIGALIAKPVYFVGAILFFLHSADKGALATPQQCGHSGQPACLNSLSLPPGQCVVDGWSVDDPTSSEPLKVTGVTDQGFGVSHSVRFSGISMFLTHAAIQAQRPTPGVTQAILRLWTGDYTGYGDLRPLFLVDTALVPLPGSFFSTDYIVVDFDTTFDTQGQVFWLELYFPSANGVCMGTRFKYTPGLQGESFVVSHELADSTEDWVDYEDVSPDPAQAYNNRSPVIRPLQLSQCARNCLIGVHPIFSNMTTENGDSVEVEAFLTTQPTHNVTLNLSVTDPTEGELRVNSLTFTPVNWQTNQHFWVIGVDDPTVDGDVLFHVQATVVSSDTCYNGEFGQSSITNRDNDFVFLETVPVGNVNNPPDGSGGGSVNYLYEIGKYEVTNTQYAAFLNAVGAADNVGLYNPLMDSDIRGGITRTGILGSYTYATRANMGNKPVNFVSFYDAMRFANWLHNGRPNGGIGNATTEAGCYSLCCTISGVYVRSSNANWAISSFDEQYKAAFYDPVNPGADAGFSVDYWSIPTMSDGYPPLKATANSAGDISNPGPNVVNYDNGAIWNGATGHVTTVGSAGVTSRSYYGTFDQGGNATERIEGQFTSGGFLVARLVGSGCNHPFPPDALNFEISSSTADTESNSIGFRVVKLDVCLCGDANGDGVFSISDAVFLINYIFAGGSAPNPACHGDANGDGSVTISDAVFLINYIFGGGSAPSCP